MKIIVNGSIIDTCDIREITEPYLHDDATRLQFSIVFFNKTEKMYVEISTGCTDWEINLNGTNSNNLIFFKDLKDLVESSVYKSNTTKFLQGWHKLIDLWSNNQTTIPKIEFV